MFPCALKWIAGFSMKLYNRAKAKRILPLHAGSRLSVSKPDGKKVREAFVILSI
jgi:hypothetical protein